MNNSLKILLDKIEFNFDMYDSFLGCSLDKIIGSSDKSKYEFIFTLDRILDVFLFDEFISKLKLGFSEYKIFTIFNVLIVDTDKLVDYYKFFINKLSLEFPLLSNFIDYELLICENVINISVANKAEEMKFRTFTSDMLEFFEIAGFGKFNIKVNILESLNLEIKEEIKAMKNTVVSSASKPKVSVVLKGDMIKKITHKINDIVMEENYVNIEAFLFGMDINDTANGYKIVTLKITDYENSCFGKIFFRSNDDISCLSNLKTGCWYKFGGYTKHDNYANEIVLNIRDINTSLVETFKIKDKCEDKRVELHTHTMMSTMDGVSSLDLGKHSIEIVDQAIAWGHKAIAITDHDGCQSFPIAFERVNKHNKKIEKEEDKFKVIYGVELTVVNDDVNIVVNENDSLLLDNTYVVFDFETTGFNASSGDTIIEIGAVKVRNGEVIEKYNELIDPGRNLPLKITEITGITNEMLKGKASECDAIKRFIEWYGNLPMVAHNAKFDVSFLKSCFLKYDLGKFNNIVIDTLELSRVLDSGFSRHNLSALVKRYGVTFDESGHHRADYDANGTGLVFVKMITKLVEQNIVKISDLNKMINRDQIHKMSRGFHFQILVKNKIGLKNLFKIISLANTKYFHRTPRILKSELMKYREGLLFGSGCYESEVFSEARSKSNEDVINIINFYDYVEVQPLEVYDHLVQTGNFSSTLELMVHVKKVIELVKQTDKILVATGDVHHTLREDKIYREIIVSQKTKGMFHPLGRKEITNLPSQHFRTTDEMLEDFSFIDGALAREIVITNTNKIADMIEHIEVIIDTDGVPFSPEIENSVETVKELVYSKAHSLYGEVLPELISTRIEQELSGIIKGGFDVIYLISQKLVKKSNDDGYLVGSRGSVGSSFVATMMGITEVNPLPAHYVCSKCCHTIFELDGVVLGSKYSSGFDLDNLACPNCGTMLNKDGQDMPFATFLGFDADKVPDIDLNFSGEYQAQAHEYTKELFGVDNVYRAGTIGTVKDKTAYGFVKGYCEDKDITLSGAEIERLAIGCTGVKRSTGQHPGGIVVIPGYMDVFDFTPFGFPADNLDAVWRTTHFDYHAIDQCLLKLDILGHDDPTVLRYLQDLSGIDVTTIPMDDKDTMSIFSSCNILGVTKDQIMCSTGTLGVPEFGTSFVIGMLEDTKPTTFSELIKISGLSHGTDVWLGNAKDLIINKVCEFKDVIGCRDDIMVYLMYSGLEPKLAFKIMEFVRKGKPSKDKETWSGFEEIMRENSVPDWYIESCFKIKYMFPKAHAAAYVMSAYRIAWFKVHHPIWYYSAYFSIRCSMFDIETMIKGYDAIRNEIIKIESKSSREITAKESSTVEVLKLALEAAARGITFASIDIEKSDSTKFLIIDNHTLLPPFSTIDGLGGVAADSIVLERQVKSFTSLKDLQKRGKVSSTLIDKMKGMGMLLDLPDSNQLTLF